MAIDTPARLAILGAGPIGLEAALYARFLGYDVAVFEAGEVAASVRRWGHVQMFTPFAMNHSPLGLAAIQAQDDSYQPPAEDALLTGREWVQRYLLPLAHTDLLAEHLRLHTTALAVGKEELLKGDMPGNRSPHAPGEESVSRSETATIADRGDWLFRVLSRDAAGAEQIDTFDGVLDCTGVFGRHNWLGHGGMPAAGELALAGEIEYRLPDILGADRARYAGRHTLLVGGGMSAATNVVALADLAKSDPATRVTWITRREGPAAAGGPIAVIDNDRLPQRAELARAANVLTLKPEAQAKESPVTYWPRTVVERIVKA
ncbi:MAG TPA: hypothetical protein VFB80_13595, partial [Pirellulaceae bacterium]|nr:hypothetical protein [Pirellulaceae bacterium]